MDLKLSFFFWEVGGVNAWNILFMIKSAVMEKKFLDTR